MTFQAIYTSGTGMLGMEKKLNVVANNLANTETTAYKKQRVNFEDLYYDNLRYPGSQDVTGEFTATGIAVGVGTRVTSVQANFSQGSATQTERDLDVMIGGEGFFRVLDPITNEMYYTRAGNFNVNSNELLVIGSAETGRPINPEIAIPQGTIKVGITPTGEVKIWDQPNIEEGVTIGQIGLSTFINPEGLLRVGENMYRETASSGVATETIPMDGNGSGVLKQGYLEMSNVSPVIELIDMITSQRAYELNSKSTQTGDQMLQTVIGIKR